MNKEQLKGSWNEIKGKIKTKWGRLTDDELGEIDGQKDILLGKLQQHYGYAKERAEKELEEFINEDRDADRGTNPNRQVRQENL